MSMMFYLSSALAIVATLFVVFVNNPVHALLYFIFSLCSLSISIYMMHAPFPAVLEVIVYAGAIMVLFVFVVMLLNIQKVQPRAHCFVRLKEFFMPLLLSGFFFAELFYVVFNSNIAKQETIYTAKDVAITLFARYGILVEIASFMLLAGLVGAYHLGRKRE